MKKALFIFIFLIITFTTFSENYSTTKPLTVNNIEVSLIKTPLAETLERLALETLYSELPLPKNKSFNVYFMSQNDLNKLVQKQGYIWGLSLGSDTFEYIIICKDAKVYDSERILYHEYAHAYLHSRGINSYNHSGNDWENIKKIILEKTGIDILNN